MINRNINETRMVLNEALSEYPSAMTGKRLVCFKLTLCFKFQYFKCSYFTYNIIYTIQSPPIYHNYHNLA